MNLINGKSVAAHEKERLKQAIEAFKVDHPTVIPHLCVIMVGNNPASSTYVQSKVKMCESLGMLSTVYHFETQETTEEALITLIETLNQDTSIHGILVQLPLPSDYSEQRVLKAIHPLKDVDGFHPMNSGLLLQGQQTLVPCTPSGIMKLLAYYQIELEGKHAVVIGRSQIVGKPIAQLLTQAHATVTLCHSKTKNLSQLTRLADLVIVAIGKPLFLTAEMIKPGATVIDVGINRTEQGTLVGDVDFESVQTRANFLTPVPGGVGPMTIIELMNNTLICAKLQTESY